MRFLLVPSFCIANAIFAPGPSATPTVRYTPESLTSLVPTSIPAGHHELLRRATGSGSISTWGSNICGWAYGEYNSIFSCRSTTSTCLWNSRLSIVGCGNTAIQPYVTACVDFNSTSCDAACSADPAIVKCGSFSRNCYTVKFPNSYYMPACGYSTSTIMSVALTYGGFPTPLYLPRYLGADGTVTAETQLPAGYTDSPTSRSSSSSSSGSGSGSETSDAGEPKEEGGKKKTNIGPIVGGVVGGVALVAGVGIGVFVFMRRRRRKEGVVGIGQQMQHVEKMDLPPGGRVELGGRPQPGHAVGDVGRYKNAYELG